MADHDLGALIGALTVSITKARYLADLQTAALAEAYHEHPLLRGVSVPRVRLPEVVLELPVEIRSYEAPEKAPPLELQAVLATLSEALRQSAREEGVAPRDDFVELFTRTLERSAARLELDPAQGLSESLARLSEDAFTAAAARTRLEQMTPTAESAIIEDLRIAARRLATPKAPSEPILRASIVSAEVKNNLAPAAITRLRIVMREEGLEWSTHEAGGATRRCLTPE